MCDAGIEAIASLQGISWIEVIVGQNRKVCNFVVQFVNLLSKDLGPLQRTYFSKLVSHITITSKDLVPLQRSLRDLDSLQRCIQNLGTQGTLVGTMFLIKRC